MQHIRDFTARQAEAARAEALTRNAVGLLRDAGLRLPPSPAAAAAVLALKAPPACGQSCNAALMR